MSERKVLNKYYPPDFDPSKIPKLRLPRNRQYSIRVMAPFNMRCNTCGEYIYKGKKFNSRKETVEGEDYLGLKIFRFYIKCPRCVSEIAFRTDPQNADYDLEDGATRNFEALRTAELQAKKEAEELEAEEANNPMKLLEKRTKASQREMDMLETLEDLRNLNSRHATVDFDTMVERYRVYEEQLRQLQDEEDENLINSLFGKTDEGMFKRLPDEDDDDEKGPAKKAAKLEKATDHLTQESGKKVAKKGTESWERSIGSLSTNKKSLAGLVRKKVQPSKPASNGSPETSATANPDVDSKANVQTSVTIPVALPDQCVKNNSQINATGSHKTTPNGIPSTATPSSAPTTPAAPSGLGLLGSYSDSESDQSEDA